MRVSVDSAPAGRGFSTRQKKFSRHEGLSSDDFLRQRATREKDLPALLSIRSMSPPDYPSAWLPPCRARLRFARQDHCSSVTTCRFSTSLARDSARTQTCQTRDCDRLCNANLLQSRCATPSFPREDREKNARRNGYPRRVWGAALVHATSCATASRFAGRSANRTPPITRNTITSVKFLWTV